MFDINLVGTLPSYVLFYGKVFSCGIINISYLFHNSTASYIYFLEVYSKQQEYVPSLLNLNIIINKGISRYVLIASVIAVTKNYLFKDN